MLIGRVENAEAEVITVSIERQDMCGECHACEVIGEIKQCKIQCQNECKSSKGDWVEIELENKLFMTATLIMYGVPLMGLLIGLGGGALLASPLDGEAKEVLIALLGIMGIISGLVWIRKREQKQKYKKLLPRAVKILEK